MLEQCNQCKKRDLEPFGVCPSYSKIKEATNLLSDVPVTFSNFQFNCPFFEPYPVLAAVTAIIIREESILLMKRVGSHGSNTWSVPGGKIDFGENWFNATQREVLEETGLLTEKFKFQGLTNDVFADDKKHFVNLIVSCKTYDNKEPRITEPLKCEKMMWITIEEFKNFKEPLFLSLKNVLAVIDLEKICKDSFYKG